MLTFAIAVLFLLITPGPGVLSAASVGAGFGYSSGLRYLIGLFWGNFLVGVIAVSGLWAVFNAIPYLHTALSIASLLYFMYLAYRVATASGTLHFTKAMSSPGIKDGIILQLLNPKAYAVNTFIFSNFLFYPDSWLTEVIIKFIIFNAVWIPIHLCWLYAGAQLKQMNIAQKTTQLINRTMAVALMLVVFLAAFQW